MTVSIFLYVAALVLFALSALGVPDAPRFHLLSAGLFCWLLADKIADGTVPFGN